ncbi:hypothetical protein G6016_13315 [Dietzia aerolata]|uniref:DUF3298 domain-containing protein n=1 Tax=Dietzia aerolata TaxID=595984 RepID=A0ABV5JUE8_9ACTN|nr:hypothetical protein [Dietzia aerolata]MBB0969917.1 hypothetical protein [Dietzia aerolata]
MRAFRTGSAVLTVASIAAVTLAGCGSSAGGAAAQEEASAELAQVVAEYLQGQPGTAYLIEYGKTVQLDMTDPRIQAKYDREESLGDVLNGYVLGEYEEHRDWTPMLDIRVDNARILDGAYICLDFTLANNIPPMSGLSGETEDGKGWAAFLPTAPITKAQITLRELSQHATVDKEILESSEWLPISEQVEYGLPGLIYDEETRTETQSGLVFAELGESVEGGHSYDESRDSALNGRTALPAGGQLDMTRCWSKREVFSINFQGDEQGRLPEAMRSGGFVVGMEIVVDTRHAIVAVPFGIAE